MKICMGTKKGYEAIDSIEPHFGYPFQVQPDRTLRCEVTGKMAAVAAMDIKAGRIMAYFPPPDPEIELAKEKAVDEKIEAEIAQEKADLEAAEAKAAQEKADLEIEETEAAKEVFEKVVGKKKK